MTASTLRPESIPDETCDLCGLTLRYGVVRAEISGKTYSFCCAGCRQVFHILLEATDSKTTPENFRNTELFQQCVEKGIIPKTESDLVAKTFHLKADAATDDQGMTPGSGPLKEESDNALHLNLKINNMWCPACAWLIDESLKKSAGVIDATCSFSTDALQVRYNPVQTSPVRIIENIAKLGYRASIPSEVQDAREEKREFIRLCVSVFLTMNVMMLSYSLYAGFFTEFADDTVAALSWPAFVMGTVVLAYGGYEFYKKAWAGLTSAAFGMETLIVMGSTSAYLYSTYHLFAGSIHLYYDTASMLITLVLIGKTLEGRAKKRIMRELALFFSLRPNKVRICNQQYPQGRYMAAENLFRGDVFQVGENEVVAADGKIMAGAGLVDESALTGEPVPVRKSAGDRILSGVKVVQGSFNINAERTGADSTLGQMMDIIEKTLIAKAPLEGKTDILLQWFVPVIGVLAVGTALVCKLSGLPTEVSVLRAITVMVISCPCALGIAIPLARVAGLSIAGRKGVLVRDFAAFEQAERVTAIVFDKTGTVTEGKWHLLNIIPVGPMTADEALAISAGLEKDSEHVIGREIIKQAELKGILPANIRDIRKAENGVIGTMNGRGVKIGSSRLVTGALKARGLSFGKEERLQSAVHSSVYLSVDGKLAALLVFGDSLRANTGKALLKLGQLGYRLALVSGDGAQTTRDVGHQIGIDTAFGDQSPQDKAAFVRQWQGSGLTVAMVGDGVNDAPALAQADLSVAVHAKGHLSKEVANVTLMRGDLNQLIEFIDFAKMVHKKITQNLTFSFIYNVFALPIAMFGFLNPLVAVTAMLLSSLTVTVNTLLLTRKYG